MKKSFTNDKQEIRPFIKNAQAILDNKVPTDTQINNLQLYNLKNQINEKLNKLSLLQNGQGKQIPFGLNNHIKQKLVSVPRSVKIENKETPNETKQNTSQLNRTNQQSKRRKESESETEIELDSLENFGNTCKTEEVQQISMHSDNTKNKYFNKMMKKQIQTKLNLVSLMKNKQMSAQTQEGFFRSKASMNYNKDKCDYYQLMQQFRTNLQLQYEKEHKIKASTIQKIGLQSPQHQRVKKGMEDDIDAAEIIFSTID